MWINWNQRLVIHASCEDQWIITGHAHQIGGSSDSTLRIKKKGCRDMRRGDMCVDCCRDMKRGDMCVINDQLWWFNMGFTNYAYYTWHKIHRQACINSTKRKIVQVHSHRGLHSAQVIEYMVLICALRIFLTYCGRHSTNNYTVYMQMECVKGSSQL